jgi:uncharacterized protein (DUF433 family)
VYSRDAHTGIRGCWPDATFSEVLADYPDLEPGDIQQALEYAAWLTQEEVSTA